ncbi:HPr kinase/phosphorylase [Carnobacterium sp. 17-4]|uniref:HPr(Ser) kinase/phosphatase n=1 Tax=Carnobacterium sp. (strain 17-4) TaxID=208596 RepID=UPI0002058F6A|nr:HPr(Ser) kinase/phosphatase [Carnobacterium sp. 17-4]AEB29106.1 HPr kinase/phosphorylase [Carnobacterium sp. 17-4]
MTKSVTVKQLVDSLKLEVHNGEEFLDRKILTDDISRPGLELTGYFNYYPQERIQLFGRTEISFSEQMTSDERLIVMRRMCQPDTPAFLISRGLTPPKELVQATTEKSIPLLLSPQSTTRLSSNVTNFLEAELAERIAMHGVLVDIYGMGVMITGDSGVGKSETALELIKRGHRLVADDRIELYVIDDKKIVGEPPEILSHLMEIRGIGIIDVVNLFGVGSIRLSKVVNLVVNLELWDKEKTYDRLGSGDEKQRILNVDVPKISIPVRTGRNLAIIIESAAMNTRAKIMGYNATETFERNLEKLIKKNSTEQ